MVAETQEVEVVGMALSAAPVLPPEGQQVRLLLCQLEVELRESLRQRLGESLGISLALEEYDEVIGKTD